MGSASLERSSIGDGKLKSASATTPFPACTNYTYDANGNTLSDAQGRSFTWDFENRLTQAVNPAVGTTTFRYDPWGRRIQKAGPNGTTNFIYDENNVITEVDSAGNALARYTQGKGIDQPLAEFRSSVPSYYETDGLGSVTSLTNSSATITATYGYDTFGNLLASAGSLTNPLRYTAREADSETGLYYYRARFYDSTLGRFLSEDRIGNDEGSNLYAYVRNAPVGFRDPTGLYTLQGFGPEHEQQMRDAIQSAIDTLRRKQKDCKDGCAGPWGPKIIQALQQANFAFIPHLFDPERPRSQKEICADAYPLNSKTIHVGGLAIWGGSCCGLDSTLAHEAMHKAQNSYDEHQGGFGPLEMEDKCFNCRPTP
jgi:RHS repeat-associated protein